MNAGTPTRLIASCFGMAGFAIAIVAGLAADNPGSRVLTVALGSMVVCHIVGLGVGLVGERTVNEYMEQYRASRGTGGIATPPIPGGTGAQSGVS